jgi:hypothetical protein
MRRDQFHRANARDRLLLCWTGRRQAILLGRAVRIEGQLGWYFGAFSQLSQSRPVLQAPGSSRFSRKKPSGPPVKERLRRPRADHVILQLVYV